MIVVGDVIEGMSSRTRLFTDREVKQVIGYYMFEEDTLCTEVHRDRKTRILTFQAVHRISPLPGITKKEESNIFAYISECQRIALSVDNLRNHTSSRKCRSSPVGNSQRNHNIFTENSVRCSQVHSLQSLQKTHPTINSSYIFNGPDPSAHKHSSTAKSATEKRLSIQPKSTYPGVKDKIKETDHDIVHDEAPIIKVKTSQKGHHDSLKHLYMWGEGIDGVLSGGGGSSTGSSANVAVFDALLPRLLEYPGVQDIQNISCGRKRAAIITKKGEIFCWGEDRGGELGHKINMDVQNPKVVDSLNGVHVVAISCSANHTCALTNLGELYAWGDNTCCFGLLDPGKSRSQWVPHRFTSTLEGIRIMKVACGEWHTAVVSSSGCLFTFGIGAFGVLGHGNADDVFQPKEVESLKGLRVKSIACGPCHTVAIVEIMVGRFQCNSAGGKLFTWGDNEKRKLGHGVEEIRHLPICVASLVDFDFVQVSCGFMLTVGLSTAGMVFTIGSSENGQLGNPLAEDKSVTVVEGVLKDKHVRKISSGLFHVVVLTAEGEVYTWGKGANGRLGLGDTDDRNSPTLVESLKPGQVETIACGYSFTAAICLHKSSLRKDDHSNCKGCRMLLSCKKHYCSSCQFAFCNSCIGKTSSMNPNKTKQFHICDNCFIQLEKSIPSRSNTGIQTPRSTSQAPLVSFDKKVRDGEIISPKPTTRKFLQRKTSVKYGKEKESDDDLSHFPINIQRWGEVPCPPQFSSCLQQDNSPSSLPKGDFGNLWKSIRQKIPRPTRTIKETGTKLETASMGSSSTLFEELITLHAQVKSLTEECNMKSEKLQIYRRRINDTWAVAKAEAENCKAAKDIISNLTAQLNALSRKVYSKGEINNLKSILSENPDLGTLQIPTVVRSGIPKFHKDVWVEQDKPGVCISLLQLLNGKRSIERLRFRYFSEMEAKKWWKDNQTRIYLKYDIDQSLISVTSKTGVS